MEYDPKIHHRQSIRLKGYDYSQNGAYFITLCSHNRKCLFGEIINDVMRLNKFGILVRDEWIQSSQIRAEIIIGEYIIMPNHLHSIVMISSRNKLDHSDRSLGYAGPKSQSISSLVAGFKSSATKKINEVRNMPSSPVWQRNYHEHIIRNQESLNQIREYIIHNPQTWKADTLFIKSNIP